MNLYEQTQNTQIMAQFTVNDLELISQLDFVLDDQVVIAIKVLATVDKNGANPKHWATMHPDCSPLNAALWPVVNCRDIAWSLTKATKQSGVEHRM